MAAIKKKESVGGGFKDKFSTKTKYKETNYYNCGEAFLSASGLPGPVMGGINMFLGHSNSSKTTAMILAAADAQKKVIYLSLLLLKRNGVGNMLLNWD